MSHISDIHLKKSDSIAQLIKFAVVSLEIFMDLFSHFCIFLFFWLSGSKYEVTITLLYVELFTEQDDWFPDNNLIG